MNKHILMMLAFVLAFLPNHTRAADSATWKNCLHQSTDWYGSAEAVRIGDNVLLYQHDNGGWEKNIDMAKRLSVAAKASLTARKPKAETTIDNGATWTQMEYLARLVTATRQPRFQAGFTRGMDYLFQAQYANGGWPQFYPLRKHGYWNHITFNDDAMAGVLTLLREVADKEPNYTFVDTERREKAKIAVQKGIECILKCQVAVSGKKTAWCAQHDETTFAPAPARKFEPVSLSGGESVGIVRFLMSIDHPRPEVMQSVEDAVSWFNQVKITGLEVVKRPVPGTPKGYDTFAVPNPAAPPIWARFYQIGTNRPIFSSRDSVIKYRMADIDYERRNGYRWYVTKPEVLLTKDYPAWKAKWAAGRKSFH